MQGRREGKNTAAKKHRIKKSPSHQEERKVEPSRKTTGQEGRKVGRREGGREGKEENTQQQKKNTGANKNKPFFPGP